MRKLPPLAALRAFEAAARHRSFQRAAAELAVTPTAISHHVRLLESTYGKKLFRRRPRPLTLTDPGERLYPVLRNGFDAFAVALVSLAESGENDPPLRVTTTSAFASRWLVPCLPLWREAHPQVPLEVIGTDAVVDIRGGEADVAIRYAPNMSMDLVEHEIFRDAFYPMASPTLLRTRRPIERAADLLEFPLIHFEWLNPGPDVPGWRRWLATIQSVEPGTPKPMRHWDLSFREELHATDAVVDGQGIAICSDIVMSRELANGTVVRAHPFSLPGYGFYLVHIPDHPRLPLITDFLAWLRSASGDISHSKREIG